MRDEPLEEWAARRNAQRPRQGDRRAIPLGDGPARARHVEPQAPRAVSEWDGHQWVPQGVAADREAADAATREHAPQTAENVPLPPSGKLPPMWQPWRPPQVWHRPDPDPTGSSV
ncbi:DUF6087 family protein [Streptomyces sp. DH12]|uniref:DUF6087 family protein n=1 Tax=Streptomyces sp. DH12 TaxID=2857010 RepID=UPI001E53B1A8|nr:DUF6087 family protein [Streptomyces sp. DH12]